jgi:Na+-transporting NADH:ubiquinone oxidoreductase subunit NqrB
MQPKAFAIDPRYFQVIFQAIFLSYGILYLHWEADWQHYIISIGGCLLFNYAAELIKRKELLLLWRKKRTDRPGNSSLGIPNWGFSVLISAMSLCLLLKVNHWYISLLAAFITVASKYIFRFDTNIFSIRRLLVL